MGALTICESVRARHLANPRRTCVRHLATARRIYVRHLVAPRRARALDRRARAVRRPAAPPTPRRRLPVSSWPKRKSASFRSPSRPSAPRAPTNRWKSGPSYRSASWRSASKRASGSKRGAYSSSSKMPKRAPTSPARRRPFLKVRKPAPARAATLQDQGGFGVRTRSTAHPARRGQRDARRRQVAPRGYDRARALCRVGGASQRESRELRDTRNGDHHPRRHRDHQTRLFGSRDPALSHRAR